MGLPPGADALDMDRAGEVLAVSDFVAPAPLAGGLAGLAARRRGAVALAPSATRVGSKKGLTVLALPCGEWTSHWPASPQVNDRHVAAWKEENHADKAGDRKRKKREEMREIAFAGRKRTGATLHFQPARLTAVSGHR